MASEFFRPVPAPKPEEPEIPMPKAPASSCWFYWSWNVTWRVLAYIRPWPISALPTHIPASLKIQQLRIKMSSGRSQNLQSCNTVAFARNHHARGESASWLSIDPYSILLVAWVLFCRCSLLLLPMSYLCGVYDLLVGPMYVAWGTDFGSIALNES